MHAVANVHIRQLIAQLHEIEAAVGTEQQLSFDRFDESRVRKFYEIGDAQGALANAVYAAMAAKDLK
jgi:hypothetical protein